MKTKLTTAILILITAFLLIAVIVNAQGMRYYTMTAVSATATAISNAEGYLSGVVIASDRTTTCTFNVYDFATNNSFSTTTEKKLIPSYVASTTEATGFYKAFPINPPVHYVAGLYATISSTGEMTLYYGDQ